MVAFCIIFVACDHGDGPSTFADSRLELPVRLGVFTEGHYGINIRAPARDERCARLLVKEFARSDGELCTPTKPVVRLAGLYYRCQTGQTLQFVVTDKEMSSVRVTEARDIQARVRRYEMHAAPSEAVFLISSFPGEKLPGLVARAETGAVRVISSSQLVPQCNDKAADNFALGEL